VSSTVHDLTDLDGGSVLVERLLPSDRIMPRVAIAVTTGGQGSVQTAVASGVPLVGIPLQPEQDLNVHLVQRQGMARCVPVHAASTTAMTNSVRRLVDEPTYREQAQRLQCIVAQIDGAKTAARVISRYVADLRAASASVTAANALPTGRLDLSP
jgi:UDP:flavonoid glycosyltransferase YjiC (YdhE family)